MVSIVIVSFNTVHELLACIESVERSAAAIPHEIIAVDNGSADGTVETVRARFRAVRLVANEENLGFSRANNQALPLVRGEYVLFLNPDAELQPGALERMLAELDGVPGRAAVGPRVMKPNEFVSRTCARRLPTLWTEFCQLLWLDRIFLRSRILAWKYYGNWDRTTDRDVECLTGAALLCRTHQVRALGGFDDSVPLYLDDLDLCKRLGDLGRLRYVSSAPVLHHYNRSGMKQSAALLKRLALQGTYRYFAKHRGRAYAAAYVVLVAAAGIAAYALGLVRYLAGSRAKALRRWDEAHLFVDWARRTKAVTYTLPRIPA